MQLNLVADRVVRGKIYPSLARFQAEPYTMEWRQFNQHWPNTIPIRLQEYFEGHGVPIQIFNVVDDLPELTYYPIALGWFNFGIDYFALLSPDIKIQLQQNRLQLLFFYHEGDNPERIKKRLDELAAQHQMPDHCYVFVSSNSAADHLDGFVSFQDSELWYWHRNKVSAPLTIHRNPRSRDFTALVRLHKWWRAVIMSDLKQHGILDHSHWSYCEGQTDHDSIDECPIEIDSVPNLRTALQEFMSTVPHYTDGLSQTQRNDHSVTVDYFFTDSYCNIVLETMFDYDQSNGVLLSEKTFKPIKHGQLFFVAGAAGSLQTLRDLGYRTFDSVLDNSYDLEQNNTQRWIKLRSAIVQAQQQGLAKLFEQARDDIVYNQNLFAESKRTRLNTLLKKIHDKSS